MGERVRNSIRDCVQGQLRSGEAHGVFPWLHGHGKGLALAAGGIALALVLGVILLLPGRKTPPPELGRFVSVVGEPISGEWSLMSRPLDGPTVAQKRVGGGGANLLFAGGQVEQGRQTNWLSPAARHRWNNDGQPIGRPGDGSEFGGLERGPSVRASG